MDPNEQKHPSSLTDEQKQALIASDPAAFDQDGDDTDDSDDQGTGGDAGGAAGGAAADGKTEGAGAAAGAGAAGADAAAGGAGAGAEAAAGAGSDAAAGATGASAGGDVPMIPKSRFDEVLLRAKQAEDQLKELNKSRAPAAPEAARDFGQEADALRKTLEDGNAALAKQYEDADIDLAEFNRQNTKLIVDYQTAMQKLAVEQASHAALSSVHASAVKQEQDQSAAAWETRVTAWKEEHKAFLSNPLRHQMVSDLLERLGADQNLSDEDLLKQVAEAAYEAFNMTPPGAAAAAPAAGAGATTTDQHKERNASDARAAAAASATPPAVTAGVGGRGGPDQGIDLSNLKPGQFSKLPRDQQERLLGEGAL